MELPITQEQLWKWEAGIPIQKAMPGLTPDQREFLMTGILPDEWPEADAEHPRHLRED